MGEAESQSLKASRISQILFYDFDEESRQKLQGLIRASTLFKPCLFADVKAWTRSRDSSLHGKPNSILIADLKGAEDGKPDFNAMLSLCLERHMPTIAVCERCAGGLADRLFSGSCLGVVIKDQDGAYLEKVFDLLASSFTSSSPKNADRLKSPASQPSDHAPPAPQRIVGISKQIVAVRYQIERLAPSGISIIIFGETGTGKDLVAEELHEKSKRRDSHFLPLNCASLGSLADSELFGHARGAFTGAIRDSDGYIGAANGGTLFLDEIGDLPQQVQAKLLRFLDKGEYMRVGDAKIRKSNVRIISATNRDLEALCREGAFRSDLYHRLKGAIIKTAPLRERRQDIPVLVKHFAKRAEQSGAHPHFEIMPDAMAELMNFDWPGNVRQLMQALRNLFTMNARAIDASLVAEAIGQPEAETRPLAAMSYRLAKLEKLREFDRSYFSALLASVNGVAKDAMQISRMDRKNFYSKLKSLGMQPHDFKPGKERSR